MILLFKKQLQSYLYPLGMFIVFAPIIYGSDRQPTTNKIELLAVGDVLLHMPIVRYAREDNSYNFDKIFTTIAPSLSGHDLAFYNQESLIGREGDNFSGYPRFHSPSQIGETMIGLGFNLVSLANNHTMDKGEEAALNSIQFFKNNKHIYTAGSYATPAESDQATLIDNHGIRCAFLAYTTLTNQPVTKDKNHLLNIFDKEKTKKHITAIRPYVDVIIVSMHWGTEYSHLPNKTQQDIAHYLAELGVDIVLGHHPHVIQPLQRIHNTWIIYSLGNFLSSQSTPEQLTGMILRLTVEKKTDDKAGNKIIVGIPRVLLTYNYHSPNRDYYTIYPYHQLDETILKNYKALYTAHSDILQTYHHDIEIYPLQDAAPTIEK